MNEVCHGLSGVCDGDNWGQGNLWILCPIEDDEKNFFGDSSFEAHKVKLNGSLRRVVDDCEDNGMPFSVSYSPAGLSNNISD